MKKISYLILLLSLSWSLKSQHYPFLEEMYDISIEKGLTYGVNATILYFPVYGEAVPEALHYDLYQPTNDLYPLRPLIIYFHSGNFLPFPNNQTVVGTRQDSSVVEMCRKLARSGFVVASADYRLGWNPVAETEIARVIGLINAAYRGVQDANTCIRHFKKTVVEDGNPFRIDTSRIILFGDDTGGYLSLNAGCLDKYEKLLIPKFIIPVNDTTFYPMVFQHLSGDVEGKNYGVNSPAVPIFPFPAGDTLCYSNYPEYSSKFAIAVNLSGGVGDTSWIDPGQPGVISVHAPYDQTTPYGEDFVYVDIVPPLRVVEVQGSYLVSSMENFYGNNDCMEPPNNKTDLQFEVTDVANAKNDGIIGLYPIFGDTISDATPWVFWDSSNANNEIGLSKNPRMTREKGEMYMDSILSFVLPRLFGCLRLWEITSTEDLIKQEDINIAVYPNPSTDKIFIATNTNYVIREICVYDMKGTLVDYRPGINDHLFYLPVDKLVPGQYVLKLQFDQGISARQIVVH